MGNADEPLKLRTMRWVWGYGAAGAGLSLVLIPLCLRMMDQDRFMGALLLFLLPMTWILNVGGERVTFGVLACAQFPIYGMFLGYGQGVGGMASFSGALGIAHAVATGICLMSLI